MVVGLDISPGKQASASPLDAAELLEDQGDAATGEHYILMVATCIVDDDDDLSSNDEVEELGAAATVSVKLYSQTPPPYNVLAEPFEL